MTSISVKIYYSKYRTRTWGSAPPPLFKIFYCEYFAKTNVIRCQVIGIVLCFQLKNGQNSEHYKITVLKLFCTFYVEKKKSYISQQWVSCKCLKRNCKLSHPDQSIHCSTPSTVLYLTFEYNQSMLRWKEAKKLLKKDSRFESLSLEKPERERLFDDHMDRSVLFSVTPHYFFLIPGSSLFKLIGSHLGSSQRKLAIRSHSSRESKSWIRIQYVHLCYPDPVIYLCLSRSSFLIYVYPDPVF